MKQKPMQILSFGMRIPQIQRGAFQILSYKINGGNSAIGDLRSALTCYQMHKKIADSMYNEASGFQLAQFQVEFETEKKDNAIKVLQQQQEIQTSDWSIQGHQYYRYHRVAVLTLLLALLYNRYRLKQRLHRQLEQNSRRSMKKILLSNN